MIGEKGDQLGILEIAAAQKLADEAGLDLVNISPKAVPPVCKIMDYGKYRFEQGKKQKEAKKNQKTTTLKEMRLSATIDTHDMEVKAKNVAKFLAGGDKVKVSIRFRGDKVAVEKPARMEGRSMFMILAPKN